MRHRTYRDKQNRHTVMVTTVDNTVLYTWKVMSVDPESAHHKKKIVTLSGDGC